MARKYEIVEFDLQSVAKITFLISFVVGIIMGIAFGIYEVWSGELSVVESVFAMLFNALFIGAMGAATAVVCGWLYNYFAKQVGGIKVKLK